MPRRGYDNGEGTCHSRWRSDERSRRGGTDLTRDGSAVELPVASSVEGSSRAALAAGTEPRSGTRLTLLITQRGAPVARARLERVAPGWTLLGPNPARREVFPFERIEPARGEHRDFELDDGHRCELAIDLAEVPGRTVTILARAGSVRRTLATVAPQPGQSSVTLTSGQ